MISKIIFFLSFLSSSFLYANDGTKFLDENLPKIDDGRGVGLILVSVKEGELTPPSDRAGEGKPLILSSAIDDGRGVGLILVSEKKKPTDPADAGDLLITVADRAGGAGDLLITVDIRQEPRTGPRLLAQLLMLAGDEQGKVVQPSLLIDMSCEEMDSILKAVYGLPTKLVEDSKSCNSVKSYIPKDTSIAI